MRREVPGEGHPDCGIVRGVPDPEGKRKTVWDNRKTPWAFREDLAACGVFYCPDSAEAAEGEKMRWIGGQDAGVF